MEPIQVDGSYGEGGGQIIRNSMSLSHITGKSIQVNNVRKGRKVPGLQPQHLMCIELISKLNPYHKIIGATKGSTEFTFIPQDTMLSSQKIVGDIRTAGSCTLLAQALLPALLFSRYEGDSRPPVVLKGGTDVSFSPPVDIFTNIFLVTLSKHFGISIDLNIEKRGFYPKGGGVINLKIPSIHLPIPSIDLVDKGTKVSEIQIDCVYTDEKSLSNADKLCKQIGRDITTSFGKNVEVIFNIKKDVTNRHSDFLIVTLAAKSDTGCLYGSDATIDLKSKKTHFDATPHSKDIVAHLLKQWTDDGCVDEYTQDQLIIFMALSKGTSRLRVGPLTDHTSTAIHFCSKMTGATFTVEKSESSFVVTCEGIGYTT
ncbi:RNA 3'-terminal phosphate cyclase [Acrasis kona]|uniref:RNA 3'-terminal phosphate cyclase n=1 Tax=Acrasis kona TaxID=1008807 RepID=A0AAW2YW55_9EUKA